jgi:hypothetical protein
MDWMVWDSNLGGVRDLLFSKPNQTGPGTHPASCKIGTGDPYCGQSSRCLVIEQSCPFSIEVENGVELYLCLLFVPTLACYRVTFTFIFVNTFCPRGVYIYYAASQAPPVRTEYIYSAIFIRL